MRVDRVNGDLHRVKHQTGFMAHCAYFACFKKLFQHGCTWAVFSASSLSTILHRGQKMHPNTCAVFLFNILMHVYSILFFFIFMRFQIFNFYVLVNKIFTSFCVFSCLTLVLLENGKCLLIWQKEISSE